jgi:hypothetical protein
VNASSVSNGPKVILKGFKVPGGPFPRGFYQIPAFLDKAKSMKCFPLIASSQKVEKIALFAAEGDKLNIG